MKNAEEFLGTELNESRHRGLLVPGLPAWVAKNNYLIRDLNHVMLLSIDILFTGHDAASLIYSHAEFAAAAERASFEPAFSQSVTTHLMLFMNRSG